MTIPPRTPWNCEASSVKDSMEFCIYNCIGNQEYGEMNFLRLRGKSSRHKIQMSKEAQSVFSGVSQLDDSRPQLL